MSQTLPFDATLPFEGTGFNRGCPPGYFAQFVPVGADDSSQPPPFVEGGPTAIRCRYIEGYTPAVNADETGQAAADSWAGYLQEIDEAVGAVGDTFEFGFAQVMPYAVIGLVAFLLLRR